MPRSLKILLVEDHVDTQRLMSRLLEASDHQVKAAGSVRDALHLADGEAFDLVISDLGLPDGDGLHLMQELRDRYGLRGIALTGYAGDEDIARSREAGFVAHLTKPIDFNELRQVIGAVEAP